ncbi:hypothetical protein F1559_003171 [Cyanidiococcus yangmingshanensis]|uniref:Cytokinin riboside 5'-monophosphate phosphoribohydrolase n=1 Tax=Cyanidiococcus yangmingshanensis TaxID=2690220 RepID=A0A7J7IFQ1_9RHOD|nr:hypothetical protein F1559_003171 [Cyanidiococcus yangmingshanensis]
MTESGADELAPRPRVITCYASSSASAPSVYQEAAFALGVAIAKRGWQQRNGGGRYGLMGKLTEGALSVGGRIDAVILDIFRVHNCHPALPSVRTVTNMAERKRGLFLESDAFVALPGGLGTLEELAEVLSWRQLGFHQKPIVLFDVDGYWQPILDWIRAATAQKMISAQFLDNSGVQCAVSAEGVCDAIEQAWCSTANIEQETLPDAYLASMAPAQNGNGPMDSACETEPAADWSRTSPGQSTEILK